MHHCSYGLPELFFISVSCIINYNILREDKLLRMSVKALRKEFEDAYEIYHEMNQNLLDIQKEVEEGLAPPETIDRLKLQIAPAKDNYERWSYIMFLLNQPQKKEKHRAYEKRNRQLLNSLSEENSLKALHNKAKEAVNGLKEFKITE